MGLCKTCRSWGAVNESYGGLSICFVLHVQPGLERPTYRTVSVSWATSSCLKAGFARFIGASMHAYPCAQPAMDRTGMATQSHLYMCVCVCVCVCVVCVCVGVCVCVCNAPMMVHAVFITCCISTLCTHAPKQCSLVVTGDSTSLVHAEHSAGGLR